MRRVRLTLCFVLLAFPVTSTVAFAAPPKKAAPAASKKKKPGKPPEASPGKKPDASTEPDPGAPPGGEGDEIQRGERVEFDARLIQGQTAKAGAVYLFERASSNLRSMVHQRAAMRDKIVATVFRPGEGGSVSEAVEPQRPKKKVEAEAPRAPEARP
ncbi:MAG: hypothetical protein HYV07_11470 [Deltaproteobacteria bacterium]|nr:hypothetical protein [Deltaproteobacteria bacterium]